MDEDSFETHDIYLAAYLQEAGCEYLGRRKQGHRVHFKFRNPAGSIEDLRTAFYAGTGKVVAIRYAERIRSFKELCFGAFLWIGFGNVISSWDDGLSTAIHILTQVAAMLA